LAAGGKYGTAQAIFQVGGNSGASLGPLLAALVVVPYGRSTLLGLACMALAGIGVLFWVGGWFNANRPRPKETTSGPNGSKSEPAIAEGQPAITPYRAWLTIGVLLTLVFSKYLYLATMTSYFTFFLQKKFHVTTETADLFLFAFLFSVAVGTFLGGPLGDHFGRKPIIWISILGVAPFSLMLPYASLFWAGVLASITGVILASAFSAIVVYAQELMPGNVGLVAGLFFGFAFGMGAVSSAVLGKVADLVSLEFVFHIACAAPLIGFLAWYLPDLSASQKKHS
jgi:FSR family fosmidomycin resistance protein-like MFS transporter